MGGPVKRGMATRRFSPPLTAVQFKERVVAMLRAQPDGTALVIARGARLGLGEDLGLIAWEAEDGGRENACDVDDSAWTEEGCFDGETPEDTWRYLHFPQFEEPGMKSILRSMQIRRKQAGN